jgi:hypothetical protein
MEGKVERETEKRGKKKATSETAILRQNLKRRDQPKSTSAARRGKNPRPVLFEDDTEFVPDEVAPLPIPSSPNPSCLVSTSSGRLVDKKTPRTPLLFRNLRRLSAFSARWFDFVKWYPSRSSISSSALSAASLFSPRLFKHGA